MKNEDGMVRCLGMFGLRERTQGFGKFEFQISKFRDVRSSDFLVDYFV